MIPSSKLQGLNLEPAALPVTAKTGLTSSTMETWITRGLPGIGWSHAVAMIRPVSSEQRAPLHDSRIDLKTVNPSLRTIPDLEVIPNLWGLRRQESSSQLLPGT